MVVENSAAATRTILENASTCSNATCAIRFLADWSSRCKTVKITAAVSARTPMLMMLSLEPLIGGLTATAGASRNGKSDGESGAGDKRDTPFHRQRACVRLAREV